MNVDPSLPLGHLPGKDVGIPLCSQPCLFKRSDSTGIHKLSFVVVSASSGSVEEDEKGILGSLFHFGGGRVPVEKSTRMRTFPSCCSVGGQEFVHILGAGEYRGDRKNETECKEGFHMTRV